MKQVFLIHAHKDLDQLNTLVGQLHDDDFVIYVNLDRKSSIDPTQLHPAARLVATRIDVRWGGFSQVEATINSLREIIRDVPQFDKVVFLSAQDFPLLPNDRLKQELALVEDRELIDTMPIGPGGWPVAFRYQYFYREGGGKPERLACALANRLLRLCKTTRRPPPGLQPYGGSSWWALSRPCLQDLLERVAREPASLRFFRTVLCPDEMFFQTMVMNSRFRERVLSENFRYIQWPEQGARNPKVLVDADFERIGASRAHFCRKLDSKLSAALLPRLVQLRQSRAGWQAHSLMQREPRVQRGS
ncbi:MAG: beta-1,6-N-acetylglucosaminyltransferase [Massilia sp.]